MSLEAIDRKFAELEHAPTDMRDHMGTLRRYAAQCGSVCEFGVWDCTSTWALLAGHPPRMRSYDVIRKPEVDEVEAATAGTPIDFRFILASTLEVHLEPVDLLFIDSLHTYAQLSAEFALHSYLVNRYIILHDTTTFGAVDENGHTPGLWLAVEEFLKDRPVWKIKEKTEQCHGLTVLERKVTYGCGAIQPG